MKTNKTYVYHSDAGHGWLAVKRKELIALGIIDQITSCSYQRGKTVYLEEDCDAQLFTNKMKELGYELNFRESHQDNSPIRSYDYFVA